MPFHSPFNPDVSTEEFGWLWADTDGDGERWNMVTVFQEGSVFTVAFLSPGEDPEIRFTDDADAYRGDPYVTALVPGGEPGKQDGALVVTISDGISMQIAATVENPALLTQRVWAAVRGAS